MNPYSLVRIVLKRIVEENGLYLTDNELDEKVIEVIDHYNDIQYVKKALGI